MKKQSYLINTISLILVMICCGSKAYSQNKDEFKPLNQTLGKTRSFSVVHGDLDGNGFQDILIVNYFSPSRIWFNKGDNTFEAALNNISTKSRNEHGGAIADLDNDGDLDIIIVATDDTDNAVFLNDGKGQFTETSNFTSTIEVNYTSVYLKDADSDGDLDAFLVVYQNSNELWLNDDNASFTNSHQTIGDENSGDMGIADLDGDNDVDIFLTNSDNPEEVWLNDGQGNFIKDSQKIGDHDAYENVAIADFDNDGDIDAVTTNKSHGITIWVNNGNGKFNAKGSTFSHARHISIADIDNDGDIDMYTTDIKLGNIMWLNDGKANFTETNLITEKSICSDIVDIDNDGDLDIINGRDLNTSGNTIHINQTIK